MHSISYILVKAYEEIIAGVDVVSFFEGMGEEGADARHMTHDAWHMMHDAACVGRSRHMVHKA